ncbi:scavenger receptor cysteine-rich domain-containing protein DMBT1-like [Misgurnus anguillicaudatus]|uniref:scavenger receptor cysteine-rich domain-containing protein DMBT1-like n=1 Tax=Misgurnus anguillicaudatus TaxID=75329 RepID=UPI003CCF89BF
MPRKKTVHLEGARPERLRGSGTLEVPDPPNTTFRTAGGLLFCLRFCSEDLSVGLDVRLINGSNQCSGRVEVLYNNQWGTICDAGWDLTDAAVVCSSMDCGTPVAAKTGAFFGQGSGPVWLDAPVRLVNGENSCSGRVEVLYNGQWGTVCSDNWDFPDAVVVCREVGCPTGAEAKLYSYFGSGVGTIWMNNVQCGGNEWSLKDCKFRGWASHNCNHSFDAGVTCRDIRLVNGSNLCSGRVEVLNNNQWGTVCDAGWDLTDAAVVCKSMGCGTPIEVKTGAFFGQGSGPVWLDDVTCSGNEPRVTSCPSKALGTSTCSHGQDAGVICNSE